MFQVFLDVSNCTLKVFHLNIAKVDLDGTYVPGWNLYSYGYTSMFQVFYLLHIYDANVLFECFKNRYKGSCCNYMILMLSGSPTLPPWRAQSRARHCLWWSRRLCCGLVMG